VLCSNEPAISEQIVNGCFDKDLGLLTFRSRETEALRTALRDYSIAGAIFDLNYCDESLLAIIGQVQKAVRNPPLVCISSRQLSGMMLGQPDRTFYFAHPQVPPFALRKLLQQPPVPATMSFQGPLQSRTLSELVHLLQQAGLTGRITVWTTTLRGDIWVHLGRIVHADVEGRQGHVAALAMFGWPRGSFRFQSGRPPAQTIQLGPHYLLSDAARRSLTEASRLPPVEEVAPSGGTEEPLRSAESPVPDVARTSGQPEEELASQASPLANVRAIEQLVEPAASALAPEAGPRSPLAEAAPGGRVGGSAGPGPTAPAASPTTPRSPSSRSSLVPVDEVLSKTTPVAPLQAEPPAGESKDPALAWVADMPVPAPSRHSNVDLAKASAETVSPLSGVLVEREISTEWTLSTEFTTAHNDEPVIDQNSSLPEQLSIATEIQDTPQQEDTMAVTANSVKETLSKLELTVEGFIGAAVADSDSGMCIGTVGGAGIMNLEVAAAANTEVVRSKRKAMKTLGLRDEIEDILITLGKQYHLIRPLRTRPSIFIYMAVDRSRANLAMARFALADVERDLGV
jgi:predicted regulator of Ras-like GTPase activity (Roadblock/LC7/MglB family)